MSKQYMQNTFKHLQKSKKQNCTPDGSKNAKKNIQKPKKLHTPLGPLSCLILWPWGLQICVFFGGVVWILAIWKQKCKKPSKKKKTAHFYHSPLQASGTPLYRYFFCDVLVAHLQRFDSCCLNLEYLYNIKTFLFSQIKCLSNTLLYNIYTYIHTYIHTLHTYIHTYIFVQGFRSFKEAILYPP